MKYRPATQVATIGRNESKVRQFTLNAKNFAKVATILSGLYPRPVPAVGREYLTNAWDSHLSAGQTRPIEVTLDSENGIFAVEDFGVGLSPTELEEIWTSYGESTKEDDEDQTGALGMGSKSAYAYTDLWTVISRKGGVQAIGINSKDSTGVPVFEIVDTVATNEPNGVRVEIPIKGNDFWKFDEAVAELLQYWPSGSVLVNGEPNVSRIDDPDETKLVLDPDVTLYNSSDDPVLVMGGVPYEVSRNYLGLSHSEQIVATIPLGAIDFTPARELELSDRTLELLDDLKAFVSERKRVVFEETIANAPTPWDGLLILDDWDRRAMIATRRTRYFKVFQGYARGRYSSYGTRASKHDGLISVGTVRGSDVVIGFSHKGVSERHKEVLEYHGLSTNTVLVQGLHAAENLKGHPNVHVWSELVATAPKPKRAKKEKSDPVVYTVVASDHLSSLTQGDDHDYDTILWTTYEAYTVDRSRIEALQTLGLFPAGSWAVAVIQDRQVNKFNRLYPGAQDFAPYSSYTIAHDAASNASESVIEERAIDDRLAPRRIRPLLEHISPSDIADPDLRDLAIYADETCEDSPEYQAFQTLGVQNLIPQPGVELLDKIERLNGAPEQYPILDALTAHRVGPAAAKSILSAINNEYRLRTLQGR